MFIWLNLQLLDGSLFNQCLTPHIKILLSPDDVCFSLYVYFYQCASSDFRICLSTVLKSLHKFMNIPCK